MLLPQYRMQSMLDARSFQIFAFDTDHRHFTSETHKKNDREKCKTEQTSVKVESDSVLNQLKGIKAGLSDKLLQAKRLEKVND